MVLAGWCVIYLRKDECHIIYVVFRYSLMLMCWEPNPEGRPSFQDIPTLIDNRMDPISDYMEMDMILQPCSKRSIQCLYKD